MIWQGQVFTVFTQNVAQISFRTYQHVINMALTRGPCGPRWLTLRGFKSVPSSRFREDDELTLLSSY